MKTLFYYFNLILIPILILSCSDDKKKEATSVVSKKMDLIIDINTIGGKSKAEVEKQLGKAESTKKIKGYPCENKNCTQSTYSNGKFEVIFMDNKANRITINNVPNLTNEDNAIEALGIKKHPYSFKNPNTVIRYVNTAGFSEISFNYDFIYIIVKK